MNLVMQISIEACVKIADGKTAISKMKDFRKKVIQVTGLTQNGFDETPELNKCCELFVNGYSSKEILQYVF